jgi:MoxR-like ATPase
LMLNLTDEQTSKNDKRAIVMIASALWYVLHKESLRVKENPSEFTQRRRYDSAFKTEGMQSMMDGAGTHGAAIPETGAGLPAPNEVSYACAVVERIRENVGKVIVGKHASVDLMLIALLSEGHVLLEDVPGMGKTVMARALARSISAPFSRIQGTADLLPADIVGVSVYNPREGTFEYRRGPIFANIVLVDEINRATPRTQSALLEAMQERQVTADGETIPLPAPFLVLATQNPIEMEGTFPLPEAQLDRFLLRIRTSYPSMDEEMSMLYRFKEEEPLEALAPVTNGAELLSLIPLVRKTRVSQSVAKYLLDLIRATRAHPSIRLGASPRAALALFRAAQALAVIEGRDYVRPDDIKLLAVPVLGHRLVLTSQAALQAQDADQIVRDLVGSLPVPVEHA